MTARVIRVPKPAAVGRTVAHAELRHSRRRAYRMGMPLPTPSYWTTALLATLPDDGQRYELVDGELLVSPGPTWDHQRLLMRLTRSLSAWLDRHPVGEILLAPAPVAVDDTTEVQPDLFVVPARTPKPRDFHEAGGLLLVVEVLSPATARHDRFTKRRLYQALGVPQYWIVDAEARAVEVWTPGDRTPRLEREALRWTPDAAGEAFVLPVAALLDPS